MAQPKDFGFGPDEQMVRDQAHKFLKDNAGIDKLRVLVAGDHEAYENEVPPAYWDEQVWQQILELGWTMLAVPEEADGAGMKCVAVAGLAEELGRAALPSPLTATLIATSVLRAAAGKSRAEQVMATLGQIAGGETTTLAVTGAEGSWNVEETDVAAEAAGDGAVLNGKAYFVQDARKVSFFVVAAKSADGIGLYAVAADAPGVTIHPDRVVDLTRDQATVELQGVEVEGSAVLAAAGEGAAAIEEALPWILTIVAADMAGAAEWQLQTTTEYARTRVQFDHQLGFFQAVKHPLVDMMIDIDRARSLVYAAASAIDNDPENALKMARMAKAAASDTAAYCSGRSVQLHGGIGFTWECDVHIYFKRQTHNQMLYGDAPYQRAKLAELI